MPYKRDYLTWLHSVTTLGYNDGHKLPSKLDTITQNLYDSGVTPEDAYDFLKRHHAKSFMSSPISQREVKSDH